jgi:hypothetical protein
MPGLSKLVNLQLLFCYQNPLKTIEDLSNLKNLNTLICYTAQLSSIPGLSKLTSLQTLIIGDNPLDTLPDLSKLTQLWMLNVWNSGISSPPNISSMGQLFTFDFNDNLLTKLPDFKNNTNLRILHAQNNQLDSVPSLLTLKYLDTVILGGNRLTQMPDLSASKASVKKIDVSNNQLSALPNFSSYTSLTTLNVQGNQLTFEDLISPSFNPFTTQFMYVPQDSVGKSSTIISSEKETFTVILGIDKSVTNNKYAWYKNGVFVKNTSVDTFAIASLSLGDSGTYTCSVSNPGVPFLVLHSFPVQLKIGKCVDLSSFVYQTSDYDCNIGGRVSYQESSISGGTKPYKVRLISKATNTEYVPNGSLFSNLYENSYQLKVTDQNACLATKDIQIGGKKTEDCDGIVIVADNSSANNQLYLEEKGTAKIFNKTGKLVRTLQTPATWDGTLQDGELIPGFYMIEHNSRNLTVTVIK